MYKKWKRKKNEIELKRNVFRSSIGEIENFKELNR